MKKIVSVLLIICFGSGLTIEIMLNRQVAERISISDCYLNNAQCVQTVLWIIFSIISGTSLILDPQPMVEFYKKFAPWKKVGKLPIQLLGLLLFILIPLSGYSLVNDCQVACLLSIIK